MKTRKPQRNDGEQVDLDLDRSARFLSAELPPRYELLYIAIVTAIGYLAGLLLDWQPLRIVTKPWPVVAMARWVMLEARERNRPELKNVAYALFLGASGDLLLELGPRTFVMGAAAFFLGHLLYIHALHRETTALHPVRALPGLVFAGGMVAILWPEVDPSLGAGFVVYGLALAGVLFRAAARIGSPKVDPLWARLGLLGAMVFAVSDAVLAIDRFHTPIAGARFIVILTYWAAQALIAASLVRGALPWSPLVEEDPRSTDAIAPYVANDEATSAADAPPVPAAESLPNEPA